MPIELYFDLAKTSLICNIYIYISACARARVAYARLLVHARMLAFRFDRNEKIEIPRFLSLRYYPSGKCRNHNLTLAWHGT